MTSAVVFSAYWQMSSCEHAKQCRLNTGDILSVLHHDTDVAIGWMFEVKVLGVESLLLRATEIFDP